MKRNLVSTLTWFALLAIYGGFLLLVAAVTLLRRTFLRRRPEEADEGSGLKLLVIGTFYTRNWCISHLTPLARARNVASVAAVVDGPTQPIPGVSYPKPPAWLVRLIGRAFSKLCCALQLALRERPDVVMGYHLLPGAMTALLVARITGARAGYQLTAGPIELIGGGAATENFFLGNLHHDSRVLEWLAFRIARMFDLLVVRGSQGRRFLVQRRLGKRVRIVPGSIDTDRFAPDGGERPIDVISVCRLVPIKQPEHILNAFAELRARVPDFRALILGDGPLRPRLEQQARDLGIAGNLTFQGHVEDVDAFLRRARVFLLTSRSEGLSIAMAEAMAAGVIPIVADVGELADLVRNDESGWVVAPGRFDEYAERIAAVIRDPQRQAQMSAAARAAAISHNAVAAVAERWAQTFDAVRREVSRGSLYDMALVSGPRTLVSVTRRKLWEATPSAARNALRPVARLVPQAQWLGAAFRRQSRFLAKAERWPREQARAYQLVRLRRILELAYERTTFYHTLFNEAGFVPRELRSLEDLRRLPTIDAQTLREHLPEMSTLSEKARGAEYVSTGGTGGRPLRFRINLNRSPIEYAYLVSSWRRAGYRLEHAHAVFRGEVVAENGAGLRHEFDPLLRRHIYSNFHMGDEELRRYIEHIATIGPCYLLVYPSSVAMLARYVDRSGQRLPENVLGILAGSENVYADERAYVTRVLGIPYFCWYGLTEKVVLGAECESTHDYHIWPTYGYFELLDDQGRPVTRPGERGEIVGTGFINTVVPFIRYRTGDFATYVGPGCAACGRQHEVIRDIIGHRTQEMLVASDGTLVSWTALNMHDETFDSVRQFQFHQDTPGQASLRVVPVNGFSDDSRKKIARSLARKLEGRLEVKIEVAEEIAASPRGKVTYVDQRIDIEKLALLGERR